MSIPNRDLLVLTKSNTDDPEAQEQEIELLNELLRHVESMEAFCVANEIINLNNYKVITKPSQVMRLIWKRETLKPFVFTNNKN